MNLLDDSLTRLDRWLGSNGWAGYDPYDVRGSSLFTYLHNPQADRAIIPRGLRKLLSVAENQFPLAVRKCLRITPRVNAKAMGLFARAYLGWYELTRNEALLDKAKACLKWLSENPSANYRNLCWGYPFDWHTKVLIPAGTPSVVVSCVVGDAFWRAYQILGNVNYLDTCKSICQFILDDLRVDRMAADCLCFSYTPVDDFHVHNANLFASEFLVRIGREIGSSQYVDMGLQAAEYALREQNPDGSLYYWGRIQDHHSPHHIDHYHSGFEIRMLYGIWKSTLEPRFEQSWRRYYRFYQDHLLTHDGQDVIPKMGPESVYPINIHSCAEAILCNATVAPDELEAKRIIEALCRFTITTMQTQDGWFLYMIREGGRHIRIPYIRWGQAWMLAAMTQALDALEPRST